MKVTERQITLLITHLNHYYDSLLPPYCDDLVLFCLSHKCLKVIRLKCIAAAALFEFDKFDLASCHTEGKGYNFNCCNKNTEKKNTRKCSNCHKIKMTFA